MKDTRHPHPHVDPRQPRDGDAPQTNPPLFAWKPRAGSAPSSLQVARDKEFSRLCVEAAGLYDPVYLPTAALAPGDYWWKWSAGGEESQVFSFTVGADAVVLEVPTASTWLQRLPEGHPRIYLRPEEVEGLRREKRAGWQALETSARAVLEEQHEIDEPAFLPDKMLDYAAFWKIWYPTMWGSRRFVKGAETLALAYVLSGEQAYGRAACRRMASIARWDPEGSSALDHNDEAHMSVIWHGSQACDWVWELFTDAERALVIEQFRRRGQITFAHMHDKGHYGIERFDSHAGREIVFLAQLALVFHEHIPEAVEWLDWLRPVLCGMWPSWAGDDGAWAQGPSYGTAYITIMTMFTTALKKGVGIDLYRRPFWINHARWREWIMPPYAEWIGFGDHSERWRDTWLNNANLVELISRETGVGELAEYVADFRREAESLDTPGERQMPGVYAPLYLAPELAPEASEGKSEEDESVLKVFENVGWAAVRTNRKETELDVAMIFRSSPYGSVSHSHANNNDFILHTGGRVLAMPSGYYAGYGSDHHAQWVWHTKSHNCITLSDAGQLMRSPDSRGEIIHAFEDERISYFCGVADASYADRAKRCRRHVVFLKEMQCFFMVDEFVARAGVFSALQWNIHSWNEFAVDEVEKRFLVERGAASLEGHFMWAGNGFFSVSEGWDPPPMVKKDSDQWPMQYNLRFTPTGLVELPVHGWVPHPRRNLGVVLCLGHEFLERPKVETARDGEVEVARVGDAELRVFQEGDVLAQVQVGGARYEVGDAGIWLG
jgi:hypothetical protein